jgi:hypothetical protein
MLANSTGARRHSARHGNDVRVMLQMDHYYATQVLTAGTGPVPCFRPIILILINILEHRGIPNRILCKLS